MANRARKIIEKHAKKHIGAVLEDALASAGGQLREWMDGADNAAWRILGVYPDDPDDLVDKVYRLKATVYHPDKGGDAAKFKALKDAYDEIKKERRR